MKIVAEDNQEVLFWVNEKDEVLGSVERKKAHDEKLVHREIALLVYDETRRVLFQKRSIKKRSNPGLWSTSVAGHIRYGYEAEEEMVREAEEEIGLKGVKLHYLGKELTIKPEERYYENWFMTEVRADYEFKLNPEEVDEVKYFDQAGLEAAIIKNHRFNPIFVNRVKLFWQRRESKGLI